MNNNIIIKNYSEQLSTWPTKGQVIMAQHDSESIVVYQAYNKSIGHYAAANNKFGGDFSFSRMTWVKPNFLWMMYRSGWGTKKDQEVTLAIRIKKEAFDSILTDAVPSSFSSDFNGTKEQWTNAVKESDVRLQWDPDHDPHGSKIERRAIQLGLRGKTVEQYNQNWIISIDDISDFVSEQRIHVLANRLDLLETPLEKTYLPNDAALQSKLGLT